MVLAAIPLLAQADQGDVPAFPAAEQIEKLTAKIQHLQWQFEALSRQVAEAEAVALEAKTAPRLPSRIMATDTTSNRSRER